MAALAVNWLSVGATTLVLLAAGGLVAAMVLAVRIVSDDSGKTSQLRDFVETIVGTPKHLLPGSADGGAEDRDAEPIRAGAPAEAFREPCPACGETVTERDRDCPGCGLRVQ